MTVKELFENFGGDPGSFCVMMPLTNTVNVEKPENVIGLAWVYMDNPEDVKVVTFPNREWEATTQYTGVTKSLYEDSMIDKPQDEALFMNAVSCPVFAYAGGMLRKSLKMMDIDADVIEIPNAMRRVRGVSSVVPEEVKDIRMAVRWLNTGVPLRKMKRPDLATNMGVKWEDRSSIQVIGRNLSIDAALSEHILEAEVEFVEDEQD